MKDFGDVPVRGWRPLVGKSEVGHVPFEVQLAWSGNTDTLREGGPFRSSNIGGAPAADAIRPLTK